METQLIIRCCWHSFGVPSHGTLHLAVDPLGRAFWRASSTSGDVRLNPTMKKQHPSGAKIFQLAMYKLGGGDNLTSIFFRWVETE